VDNIGQRLKEERQLRGWSQRDLARETGVNTDTISGIETGQHEPRPSTLRKLAEGLGIEVRDLFMELTLPKAPAREAGQPEEEILNSVQQEQPGRHIKRTVRSRVGITDEVREELRSYFDAIIATLTKTGAHDEAAEVEEIRDRILEAA
jgi:transcriptional regulator with XRE-family HTH domain